MIYMFRGSPFNRDISNWDVSNVTNMYEMFYNNQVFNQDLSLWDVVNVENWKILVTTLLNGHLETKLYKL